MLNNVLYADLTGVFLVVGCTLFISLVNCLSEIFYSYQSCLNCRSTLVSKLVTDRNNIQQAVSAGIFYGK